MTALALPGCAGGSGEATLRSLEGGPVQFEARGSMGDGVDDVRVFVYHEGDLLSGPSESIVPWKTTTGVGPVPTTVSMTVESLSSDGEARCTIHWGGRSVSNTARGDHAVAECIAHLEAGR
ncbi:hypothetical protein [Desertivibrio insolitus]|uniref:hypothetical protein n=1 Tax=Herbiconiux sp. SYSU D00978 TaxID=2812562 RepID=UPI001A9636BB|nr:hypothetical protein [Herbiconiux sp. SYSU D00978]